MKQRIHRRDFIKTTAGLTVSVGLLPLGCRPGGDEQAQGAPGSVTNAQLFEISLAQWSLHRALRAGEIDPLDFPVIARRDYGIEGAELVNQFYVDHARDMDYLGQLKERADGEDVSILLIMCDNEGDLGDPDNTRRTQSVENHHKWVDAAAFLGCHSIRVNARSDANLSPDEQQRLAADGLRRLCEYGDQHDINVIVENHGGISSNGQWLAGVMRMVDHPRVGTLPDFGNFRLSDGPMDMMEHPEAWYDRYQGVSELMPYAKAVSAKTHEFDAAGNCVETDYMRMMKIVLDAGYRGFVGIEYEGDGVTEPEGIRATKALLERVRTELAPQYA